MDTLLTTAAILGAVAAGFVLGDYLTRRKVERDLAAASADLRGTLERIQAVHNQLVTQAQDMGDRIAGLEMRLKVTK